VTDQICWTLKTWKNYYLIL